MKHCSIKLILLIMALPAMAAPTTQDTILECTTVGVDYLDKPELSRAEKLILMEKAFYDSLNKFELCQVALHATKGSSSTSANLAGGEGAEHDGNSSEGSEGNENGNDNGIASVASDTMQGTESDKTENSAHATSGSFATTQQGAERGHPTGAANLSNGKTPEDIPPAANDDAIAAQIRVAAEAEADAEIREKLWNEYRKYKGMNVGH